MSNRTIVTPGIWASGAPDVPTTPATGTTYKDSGITPQNVIDALKYNTIADSSKLNEILYRLTALMLMLEQYGTLPFCPTTTYGTGGTCIGSNGVIYQSKANNNYGHDPVNDTGHSYWDVLARDNTPVGTVIHIAKNTAPAGYLKCNGAAVSRTTYADLFAAIGTTYGVGNGSTTFNVPDVRGEFIRGFDDGRGVDAGRTIGSTQADDFKSHTHPFTDSTVSETSRRSANSVFSPGMSDSFGPLRVNISSTTNAAGGTETRPRNIAFLACIKY